MEEQYIAVPFSLVGFFMTNKSIDESIRSDITAEEMEKLQNIIATLLFNEGVKVAVYPSVVPPDQAEEVAKELEDMIFGEEE